MIETGGYRSDFSSLAAEYATYRTSYGSDLFDTIASYADVVPTNSVVGRASLAQSAGPTDSVVPTFTVGNEPRRYRALDLACGTGLSTAGLIARGYAVTGVDIAPAMLAHARQRVTGDRAFYEGRAEALPFADDAFELVTCAQAFHWFDPAAAFGEIARVLRRGGALALFWKHESAGDPFQACAAGLMREISGRDEPFNVSRTKTDRFDEFWSEHRAFRDHELWRLPLELSFTVDSFVGYHSSREIARFHLGDRRAEFLTRLQNNVAELAPGGAFVVKAMQYLYLARRR